MKPIFTIILLFVFFTSFTQNRLYVNTGAVGANNGQSWTDAFSDLNLALDAALSGDTVWVAEGTYIPTTDSDRTLSFVQKSGVRLYGGFSGMETSLNQRDWQAHPTMLSGDIGMTGDSTDNSYTILYMNNPDSMTVLDGFFFRHGIANYTSTDQIAISAYKCGGALYIMAMDGWAYPLVKNCHFGQNYAYSHGGAVYVNGSGTGSVAPQFINCTFENNRARLDGGALYRNGGSWVDRSPDFGNCLFKNNIAARRGGGLCYNESERTDLIELHECTFLENRSALTGGGANFNVGRVTGTNIAMKGCFFEGNGNDGSTDKGEAFALASLNYLDMGQLIIDSCTFFVNDQGAIFWDDVLGEAQFKMSNTLTNYEQAGSYYRISQFSNCEIIRSKFNFAIIEADNQIYFSENFVNNSSFNLSKGSLAKIFNNIFLPQQSFNLFELNSQIMFASNTIAGGEWGLSAGENTKLEFQNCVLSGLGTLWFFPQNDPAPQISFDNCLFKDNSLCLSPPPIVTCGPNNLFGLDPQFRDPANGDYSLLPCSPLINAGSNLAAAGILTDIAGNPRIQDGTVDIGAYESPGFALASIPTIKPACEGASNGSILVEPVFGCEPYTYNWLPADGNGPELNGLPPGNYLLTITDGSGRQILDTLSVAAAPTPELSPLSTDVQCSNGLGGSIASGLAGGMPPYHYEWLPLAADTSYLASLPPGNYALTVTDVHGCQDSASTSIALQGMITLMIDGQAIPCFGETGWLSATPVTGAAPFQWLWQGWPGTDSLAQPLGPGQYAVTVQDAYGCTASNTFPNMTEPSLITATIDSDPQTDLTMPNGGAEVSNVSGGSPAFPPLSPYQFIWSNGGMESFIDGLTAGAYTVTITDKNGCSLSLEVVVDLMVGTKDPSSTALLLYPNPAADWLRVVLPEQSGACTLELLDANGLVLRSVVVAKGQAYGQLDLEGLPGGSYWARVVGGKEMFFGKVVKR